MKPHELEIAPAELGNDLVDAVVARCVMKEPRVIRLNIRRRTTLRKLLPKDAGKLAIRDAQAVKLLRVVRSNSAEDGAREIFGAVESATQLL